MSMFCYQCQETMKNQGCAYNKGMCGKPAQTAHLQDILVYTLKGIALAAEKNYDPAAGLFIAKALFATITNANFDDERIIALIKEGLTIRDRLKKGQNIKHDALSWTGSTLEEFSAKVEKVGVLATKNVDIRSLRELLTYGMKGISAYAEHAAMLGKESDEIYKFLIEGLASTLKELTLDEMIAMVMKAGDMAVKTMALLDQANTSTYGHPEITEVNIGVGKNPGILISGHDLRDMQDLLNQTEESGIDVYTHSEMLPANYYPAFKKYKHFVGNYGNSWWKQNEEFASFNGPILMTTNCIIPLKDAYKDRIFTTGMAGYPGVPHIAERIDGKSKDFSQIIEMAATCPPPAEIETGKIIGGFAHNQVIALADKIVAAVKSGAIRKFVVMAGCDGRHKERNYYTDFAEALPPDTVILTAGCAKYRYNKLDLGDIDGIPRVLDAGQCNDSYSLAVIALKLKDVFQLNDINELPIVFNIAWYEQKAVAVLLALLALGIKNIHLGPTLPAFLSPAVVDVLVKNFNIAGIGTVEDDIKNLIG